MLRRGRWPWQVWKSSVEDRLSSTRRLVANGHGGGKKKPLNQLRLCVRVEGLTVVKELTNGVEFARLFQVYHVGQQGQHVDCVSLCCVT